MFRLYQKDTPTICLIFISLMFMYCLFVEEKLVTIEIFLLNFFGGSKCMTKLQFLLKILKRVDKYPFLRPQMIAKDTFS